MAADGISWLGHWVGQWGGSIAPSDPGFTSGNATFSLSTSGNITFQVVGGNDMSGQASFAIEATATADQPARQPQAGGAGGGMSEWLKQQQEIVNLMMREDEEILMVIMAAVTSGALE